MVRLVHMAHPRMRRTEHGFTLIETMIALAVFMVGLLALVSMQVSVIKNVQLANEMALATNLASAQLEEMELIDAATLEDGESRFDNAGAQLPADAEPYFTVTWVVTTPAATNLRDVTVTTSWSYSAADPHAVSMTSRYWNQP